jgi:hypothetical protein
VGLQEAEFARLAEKVFDDAYRAHVQSLEQRIKKLERVVGLLVAPSPMRNAREEYYEKD